jgi:hypothetical protein
MMIVVMVGVLLLFRRSNGMTVFVIGVTSVRNWFHVALLVGGKQHLSASEKLVRRPVKNTFKKTSVVEL